jgi:hypothetical protein
MIQTQDIYEDAPNAEILELEWALWQAANCVVDYLYDLAYEQLQERHPDYNSTLALADAVNDVIRAIDKTIFERN